MSKRRRKKEEGQGYSATINTKALKNRLIKMAKSGASKEDAIQMICSNQLGRPQGAETLYIRKPRKHGDKTKYINNRVSVSQQSKAKAVKQLEELTGTVHLD